MSSTSRNFLLVILTATFVGVLDVLSGRLFWATVQLGIVVLAVVLFVTTCDYLRLTFQGVTAEIPGFRPILLVRFWKIAKRASHDADFRAAVIAEFKKQGYDMTEKDLTPKN